MDMSSLGNFLAYGAIGLGLGLAILAYLLLLKEQGVVEPRKEIIKAIYVFMVFALLIAAAGFLGEYMKSEVRKVKPLRAELELNTQRLSEVEEKNRQMEKKLSISHDSMQKLMNVKAGSVARLRRLDPNAPGYGELVNEIQRQLEGIDRQLNEALNE